MRAKHPERKKAAKSAELRARFCAWLRLAALCPLLLCASAPAQGFLWFGHKSAPAQAEPPWAVEGAESGTEAERQGAEQNPRILASYGGEYRNMRLERMVAKIVGRLAAASASSSGNSAQIYRVVILDSANINAFALPGGYVYVTRGLLALANDSAEVAAVIAHEMAHISAGHGVLRAGKEREIAVAGRVAGEALGGSAREEALLRGRLKLAGFSRAQELQADSLGIRLAAAAGYDPFAAPRFLQAMEDYSRFRDISGAQDAGLDFLSNHPSAPQRVRYALAEARKAAAPAAGELDRAAFLRGIDGMIFGDDSGGAGIYIRGRSFIDAEQGFAFAVPRGFALSYKNGAAMAAGAGSAALRFDSAALPAGQSLSAYIAGGWISGLDKASVRVRRIAGLPAAEAEAQSGQWRFSVLVLGARGRVYRFLSAAPKNGASPAPALVSAAASFRLLSEQEKAGFAPLRLRIVTAAAGDTAESLAEKMQFNDSSLELFRILNGFGAARRIQPGDTVKLIMQ